MPEIDLSLPIEIRVNNALQVARDASAPLIDQIEATRPGNQFGAFCAQHMLRLEWQASMIGPTYGFDNHATQLLRLVLGTHDTDRHLEQLKELYTLRPGVRHGVLSIDFLTEKGIFNHLTPEETYIVSHAIQWHSEKAVDILPPDFAPDRHDLQQQAIEMCYVLRDLDKLDILGNPLFSTPQGIYREIHAHYLVDAQRQQDPLQTIHLPQVTDLITFPKAEESIPSGAADSLNIVERISQVLSTGLTESGLEAFTLHNSLDIKEVAYSYANYMLLHLAMIFDIRHNTNLAKILAERDKFLSFRLGFIQKRTDPETFSLIQQTLTEYFEHRLQ